jgi:hypothetical protein
MANDFMDSCFAQAHLMWHDLLALCVACSTLCFFRPLDVAIYVLVRLVWRVEVLRGLCFLFNASQVFCSIFLKLDLVNISSASAPGSWLVGDVVTVSCSAPRPALVGVCRPRAQRHVTLVSKAVPPAARRLSQFFIINAYCFSSPEGSIFLPVLARAGLTPYAVRHRSSVGPFRANLLQFLISNFFCSS